jgi:hypothetical protein
MIDEIISPLHSRSRSQPILNVRNGSVTTHNSLPEFTSVARYSALEADLCSVFIRRSIEAQSVPALSS